MATQAGAAEGMTTNARATGPGRQHRTDLRQPVDWQRQRQSSHLKLHARGCSTEAWPITPQQHDTVATLEQCPRLLTTT